MFSRCRIGVISKENQKGEKNMRFITELRDGDMISADISYVKTKKHYILKRVRIIIRCSLTIRPA